MWASWAYFHVIRPWLWFYFQCQMYDMSRITKLISTWWGTAYSLGLTIYLCNVLLPSSLPTYCYLQLWHMILNSQVNSYLHGCCLICCKFPTFSHISLCLPQTLCVLYAKPMYHWNIVFFHPNYKYALQKACITKKTMFTCLQATYEIYALHMTLESEGLGNTYPHKLTSKISS